jgi:sugar-phosphatase
VVVEDAPSGAQAGVAAGSPVLGVLGTHAAEELRACTWVVRSLDGLVVKAKANSLELEFEPVGGEL